MVCLSGRGNRKGEKERKIKIKGEQFIHRESEIWCRDIREESVNLKWLFVICYWRSLPSCPVIGYTLSSIFCKARLTNAYVALSTLSIHLPHGWTMAFPPDIPPSASTTLNPITKLIISRLHPIGPIVYPLIWIIDLQPGVVTSPSHDDPSPSVAPCI